MWLPIGARLVIASDGENCKINSEPDQNGAECHANHAESSEKKLSRGQRYEAGEKKANRHADQWQPSAKACEKNDAYQHD